MIITRTPYRVSFLGGGTDYPAWYRQHGGAVLAATIDKYCYLTCRYLPPFFEHRIRVVYSKIELCQTIDEITHPAAREILRFLNVQRGVEIHHDGDLPARSGVGSSSAFTIGLLHALHALQGRTVSKRQLAEEGMHLEQAVLQETVGSQDQVLAAYGGLNHVQFLPTGDVAVRPVILPRDRLAQFNAHLMLFYTGIKRTAADVARSYAMDIERHDRPLRKLSDLVDEGLALLCSDQDLRGFGALLHEAWLAKKALSASVSHPYVDQVYEEALSAGALGGKLLGAGGGGFLLLFVPLDKQACVRRQLSRLLHVPFQFEFSGSHVVLVDREVDYAEDDRARGNVTQEAFREVSGEWNGL